VILDRREEKAAPPCCPNAKNVPRVSLTTTKPIPVIKPTLSSLIKITEPSHEAPTQNAKTDNEQAEAVAGTQKSDDADTDATEPEPVLQTTQKPAAKFSINMERFWRFTAPPTKAQKVASTTPQRPEEVEQEEEQQHNTGTIEEEEVEEEPTQQASIANSGAQPTPKPGKSAGHKQDRRLLGKPDEEPRSSSVRVGQPSKGVNRERRPQLQAPEPDGVIPENSFGPPVLSGSQVGLETPGTRPQFIDNRFNQFIPPVQVPLQPQLPFQPQPPFQPPFQPQQLTFGQNFQQGPPPQIIPEQNFNPNVRQQGFIPEQQPAPQDQSRFAPIPQTALAGQQPEQQTTNRQGFVPNQFQSVQAQQFLPQVPTAAQQPAEIPSVQQPPPPTGTFIIPQQAPGFDPRLSTQSFVPPQIQQPVEPANSQSQPPQLPEQQSTPEFRAPLTNPSGQFPQTQPAQFGQTRVPEQPPQPSGLPQQPVGTPDTEQPLSPPSQERFSLQPQPAPADTSISQQVAQFSQPPPPPQVPVEPQEPAPVPPQQPDTQPTGFPSQPQVAPGAVDAQQRGFTREQLFFAPPRGESPQSGQETATPPPPLVPPAPTFERPAQASRGGGRQQVQQPRFNRFIPQQFQSRKFVPPSPVQQNEQPQQLGPTFGQAQQRASFPSQPVPPNFGPEQPRRQFFQNQEFRGFEP